MNSTLDYYNQNAQLYFDATLSVDMEELYQPFLSRLRHGAKILDAGCGSGRDTLYFKQLGFSVTPIDGSEELVKRCSNLTGENALLMSFDDLTLPENYDGIWACSSLLHVKRQNLVLVFKKLVDSLNTNGIFYASFKYGDCEYFSEGRYFNCLDEKQLKSLVAQIPQLKIIQLFISKDKRPKREHELWLNAYLCKI